MTPGRRRGDEEASGSIGVAAAEVRLVVVAVTACFGTFIGPRLPAQSVAPAAMALGMAAVTVAVVRGNDITSTGRRRMIAGLMLVLSLTGVRSAHVARAHQPLAGRPVRAEAMLRTDPEPIGVGWRAELQLGSGDRVEATAFGRASFVLRRSVVGDRILAVGRVRPIGERPWLRARHIVARLSLDEAEPLAPAAGFDRLVNELRSVVIDGAASFDDRTRPLYTGLVIGDDRFQSLAQRAQFRASGLSHLLAVSGQNVAFVLLVTRPVLMALGRRTRLAAIVVVLVVFAAMTRAEPSVLRASTAAGVGAWSLVTGRLASGLRTLSIGVTALLVIDPFLLDVVGFQLSVVASIGIVVVSPLLLARLPASVRTGRVRSTFAQALAVTVGAQLAVAPLLIGHFGPLPLASVPANLAAGWAAGLVMTLGLTVGPISGLLHRARFPAGAALVQWPTRLLVDWVDATARWAAGLNLPRLGLTSLAALLLLGLISALRPRRGPLGVTVAVGVLLVATGVVVGAAGSAPDRPAMIAEGVLHIPPGATDPAELGVLVVRDAPPSAVDTVLASGVGPVDVVIAERGDPASARVVLALIEVVDATTVLAPPQHRIPGASRVTEPTAVATAWGIVRSEPDSAGTSLVVAGPPTVLPGGHTPSDPDR